MTTLELTAEETEALVQALEQEVFDLKSEITHTDNEDYKEMLKHRRALLSGILNRIGAEVS